MTKEEVLARFSRSQSKAQSGPQSAFMPLDCGPAGAICDLLRLAKSRQALHQAIEDLSEEEMTQAQVEAALLRHRGCGPSRTC